MESLANKVILIAGASSGIGGCTARYLSKFKTKLVLVARSEDRLKKVQQQCEKGCGKGNVVGVTADLGKQEELARVISEAVRPFGKLDVLVNNAACLVLGDLEHTTPDAFDRTMAVNVRAPFFLTQAAAPHLKKTKGCIINISSIAGFQGVKEMSVYSVSKAALDLLTRVSALELAPSGVRVNSINLGLTATDTQMESAQLQSALTGESGNAWEAEKFRNYIPLGGEFLQMEDVAKVISFLASDLSSAMTGSSFCVDKGTSVVPPMPQDSGLPNMGDVNAQPTQVLMEQLKTMAETAKAQGKGGKKPSS